ncbi:DEAD/DEAH box helicase [Bacillus subtilis]|uniref:ATP-dependent helicase ComFA n=1 Tax=Bacillus sp. LJBS06 TaxID=2809036 RepID=UPI0011C74089|nr:DEAD/DEAH box helicase [Bacillus sp. LJBS06]QRZ92407.1 DEAD/DEAH box helicase [Bacillus sp. LJBS06]TXF69166.1 DEAD/DEAH box helicase [Bacillus subtilis]
MKVPTEKNISFSRELQQTLQSRHLLRTELPFSDEMIEWHIKNGYITAENSISINKRGYRCNRCGQTDKRYFSFYHPFGKDQLYCRSCIMMGRVSEEVPLYSWKEGDEQNWKSVKLTWGGKLSSGQQKAANILIEAISKREELLIWAVCGAGKTEMLFPGIESALNQGLRVCIATPRTDVVLELAPRLKAAFQGADISALYGVSDDKGRLSPLMISTTHQLLRYKDAFDVMIVDEVDAFPYSADQTLQFAVQKARKKNSTLVYLSATPPKELKRKAQNGQLHSVRIPARHHRKPLPEPRFVWCGNWKKKLNRNKIPPAVKRWIEFHVKEGRPVFLFVPSVSILEKAAASFKDVNCRTATVHAEDKHRKEKVQRFRDGQLDLLITTTILERGVTVPKVQTGVLGAESPIFTESALIQIAGRTGRHKEYADGDVIFFHFGKTKSMLDAKKHIKEMNGLAAKNE